MLGNFTVYKVIATHFFLLLTPTSEHFEIPSCVAQRWAKCTNVNPVFTDVDRNTALFFAAEGGHLPCVALLMVSISRLLV